MSSTVASRCLVLARLTALAVGALVMSGAGAGFHNKASAQSNAGARTAAPTTRVAPVQAETAPLIAVITLGNQRITVYDRNGVVETSPISSGRRGYETPEGIFSILERKEEHFSNLYEDAEMPFMQRLTWSGVAMHAGILPGYPASHGCVRLPAAFAERLFGLTKLNTRVVITSADAAPQAISHPVLFQPLPPPDLSPTKPPQAPAEAKPSSPAGRSGDVDPPMMLGLKPERPSVPESTLPAQPQRAVTTVLESVQVQRAATVERAAAAVKAADQAKLVVRTKLAEAQKADRQAKAQSNALRRTQDRVASAERALARARSSRATDRAKAAISEATSALERLTRQSEEARTIAAARLADAQAATEAAKLAEANRTAAQAEVRDFARRMEPISVFISRKTSRLYVRQGRQPVFDVPFALKDPATAVGTHVFTAIDQTPDGTGVRWNVISVEGEGVVATQAPPKPKKRGEPAPPPPAPQLPSLDHATAVLDRLEFSKELRDRISPYLRVGSSLIVSDHGPSIETGRGTDFVIQTRGEERAVEFIANYVAEQRKLASARRN